MAALQCQPELHAEISSLINNNENGVGVGVGCGNDNDNDCVSDMIEHSGKDNHSTVVPRFNEPLFNESSI